MLPIRDENPTSTTPFITVGLIVINVLVYVYQLMLGPRGSQALIYELGAIPFEITHFENLGRPDQLVPIPLTLFSAMFVHGGFVHLGGNMLFLWIFGDNIEDTLGHFRYLVFYLLCGLVASASHILINVNSQIPMVGASGAIAGVLGAYFILYPHARVLTLVFLLPFFLMRLVPIPALLLLVIWFLMQISGSLGSTGGVAWYAHIGGFIAGVLLIRRFTRYTRRRRVYEEEWF